VRRNHRHGGLHVFINMEIKARRFLFIAAIFAIKSHLFAAKAATPSSEPLIYANHLEYLGAFKVPAGTFGDSSFSYGGAVMAYSPANNSLFMVGHDQRQDVAEISIPDPVKSQNTGDLKIAAVLQHFSDITEGNLRNIGLNGSPITDNAVKIGGLLVFGNKLIGTSYGYYDASGQTQLSHFISGLDLAAVGDFKGMYQVGFPPITPNPGYIDGYMAPIPPQWQPAFGGPALTGQTTIPITGRTSYGPDAFVFDPNDLGATNPVSALPVLYYPQSHPNLGGWGTTNPWYNGNSRARGMVFPNGSRSMLFFGFQGLGSYCYGSATADPALIGSYDQGPADPWCYDPSGVGGKGPHGYPYQYQVWAYDANELLAVKNGLKSPWNVLPYAVWNVQDFPFAGTNVSLMAAAYDPASQRLFLAQPGADKEGCCDMLPLIQVYRVNLNAPAASSYKIKGQAMTLRGTVVLKNNGGDTVSVASPDRTTTQNFEFAAPIDAGGSYDVTVANQPAGQVCAISNGTGKVNANADITNIIVACNNTSGADTSPPTTPGNLWASALSPTQIVFSWSPSTDDILVAGYRVYRNGTKIATTTSGVIYDSGLIPATTYGYTVEAFDFSDNAAARPAPVQAATLPLLVPNTAPPAAPKGLNVK